MKRKQYSSSSEPDSKVQRSHNDEAYHVSQSKLFDLQSAELINEVNLSEKQKKKADEFLHELSDVMQSLEDGSLRLVNDIDWMTNENIKFPLKSSMNNNKSDNNLRFTFRTPEVVQVIGSYSLGTSIRPRTQADLLVEMPKDSIEAKDYMNQIYLQKRALYLVELAVKLRDCPLIDDDKLSFSVDQHTAKPYLIIYPKGTLGNHFSVRVHTCPQQDLWKLLRFEENKSNLRQKFFYNEKENSSSVETNDDSTPIYNSLIGRDLVYKENMMNIHENIKKARVIKDCIKLMKVWIIQRQFNTRIGGFNGFHLTMYINGLINDKHLTHRMSKQQCIRVIFTHLAAEKWPTYLANYRDQSNCVNYGIDVDVDEFQVVSKEAELALQCLNSNKECSAFTKLFITKMSNNLRFDQILTVDISNKAAILKTFHTLGSKHELMDSCNDPMKVVIAKVRSLVKRALGARLSCLPSLFYDQHSFKWPVDEDCPVNKTKLHIGLQFDHQKYTMIQDRCTSTGENNQLEINEFREFWGDKCELRRFPDGSICESVLWSPCETMADKRRIIGNIVDYTLKRHLNMNLSRCDSSDAMTSLQLPVQVNNKYTPNLQYGTGEEVHSFAVTAAEQLCKDLRNLSNDDIPLLIVGTHLIAPTFRGSETFPPRKEVFNTMVDVIEGNKLVPKMNHPCPLYTPSLEVLCVLESSGQWPEQMDAVARVKTALILKLNHVISKKFHLVSRLSTTHLDVFKDDFVFRLRLCYTRELTLSRMFRENPDSPLKMIDTAQSLRLQYNIDYLPKVCSYLNGINQANITSYSSACRLCKRWLSSQMLLDNDYMFSEVLVELMVSYLYIDHLPFDKPACPNVAFMRFLNLLSTFDFKSKPLIVNFNDELDFSDYSNVETKFKREAREGLPSIVVVTPNDISSTSLWKKQVAPSAVILNYCRSLAKQSCQVDSQTNDIIKMIFAPSYECFDLVIHLNQRQLSRSYMSIILTENVRIPNAQRESKHPKLPVIDYDPSRIFLQLIRESFNDIAIFFHDTHGGDKIAVLLRPDNIKGFEDKEAKIEDMVEQFSILGKGLVKNVEIK